MRTNYLVSAGALALAAALSACSSDSTSPGSATPGTVALSFATTGASTTSRSIGTPGAGVFALTAATDSLVITKAQVVLARLELQRAGATCASTETAGDDEKQDDNSCAELELAPSIVNLSVNGGVTQALNSTIPTGTYSAFEAKIRVVEARKTASTAFLTAHPEMAGASVRVEGTFNGKAFTYTGAPKAEIEGLFNPALVADSTGANITINVDLTNWFRTSGGSLVDPATANAGGANATLVSSNIARSFKAFRDDDRDGRDDRGSNKP
ncbi:MAG: hypothetical protein M3Z05_06920 [Gemmatimonadota bacterium]|nr:hypothetical protein [Gemmatimonadota bacterium]